MRLRISAAVPVVILVAVACSDDEIRNESSGSLAGAGVGPRASGGAPIGGTLVGGLTSAGRPATGGLAGATLGGALNAGGTGGSTTENLAGRAGDAVVEQNPLSGNSGVPNGGTPSGTNGGAASIASAGHAGTTIAVCGNGWCDVGESPSSCCVDCGCLSVGSVCRRGTCATPMAIAAGGFHTCVLLGDGTVECWGGNAFGEIGNGSIATSVISSTTVSGLSRAKAIAAGASFTCAMIDDGAVRCWGANASGQLGDGTKNASPAPVTVVDVANATAIATGFDSACAVLANGSVKCWGNNANGQLGNGTTTSSAVPVPVADIADAIGIAVGYSSACAIIRDGTVRCWGSNTTGQLGDGSNSSSSTPVTVFSLAGAKAIAATCDEIPSSVLASTGDGSACAVLENGAVRCWGSNVFGELGKGNMTTSSPRSVPVMDLANAAAISAGNKFACAIEQSGAVKCWGNNAQGQLGNGTTTNSTVPTIVSRISCAKQVATGAWHTCALLFSGTIECWGGNTRNELGNDDAQMSSFPMAVPTWSAGAADSGATNCGSTTGAAGAGGTGSAGNAGMSGMPITTGGVPSTGGTIGCAGTTATGGTFASGGTSTTGGTIATSGAAGAAAGSTSTAGTAGVGQESCSVSGATECKGRRAVRTCTNGAWIESACGGFQACAAGACRDGCPELAVPIDAEVACYMPVDPFGEFHGSPFTAMPLSSDLAAVPAWVDSGFAYDSRGTGTYSDDTAAPVVPDPLGLIWRTSATTTWISRLYLSAYLDMDLYSSKFGAPPSSIALHVKMRRIPNPALVVPWPAFTLVDGNSALVTEQEDDSAFMTPSTEWAVYTREFTAQEISGLTLNSIWNWFELDFGGDKSRSIAPETVDVAWFAVTYGAPK